MLQTRRPGCHKGFTLVEVMLTVAILAFGIIAIYEALFVSMDAYGYYSRSYNTQDWIGEKIWLLQRDLTDHGFLEVNETAGQVKILNKTFDWTMSVYELDVKQGLYRVKVTLSWIEGRKTVSTHRETYLLSPKLISYDEEGSV